MVAYINVTPLQAGETTKLLVNFLKMQMCDYLVIICVTQAKNLISAKLRYRNIIEDSDLH